MGGGRVHWLKVVGTVAGRQGDEREKERERGKRTAEYNGGVNEWSRTTAIEF